MTFGVASNVESSLTGLAACNCERGAEAALLLSAALQDHGLLFSLAVSNAELRGATQEAAAQVIQWVSFADSDIVPPASTWVFPTLGIMHYNKQVRGRGRGRRPRAAPGGRLSKSVLLSRQRSTPRRR